MHLGQRGARRRVDHLVAVGVDRAAADRPRVAEDVGAAPRRFRRDRVAARRRRRSRRGAASRWPVDSVPSGLGGSHEWRIRTSGRTRPLAARAVVERLAVREARRSARSLGRSKPRAWNSSGDMSSSVPPISVVGSPPSRRAPARLAPAAFSRSSTSPACTPLSAAPCLAHHDLAAAEDRRHVAAHDRARRRRSAPHWWPAATGSRPRRPAPTCGPRQILTSPIVALSLIDGGRARLGRRVERRAGDRRLQVARAVDADDVVERGRRRAPSTAAVDAAAEERQRVRAPQGWSRSRVAARVPKPAAATSATTSSARRIRRCIRPP